MLIVHHMILMLINCAQWYRPNIYLTNWTRNNLFSRCRCLWGTTNNSWCATSKDGSGVEVELELHCPRNPTYVRCISRHIRSSALAPALPSLFDLRMITRWRDKVLGGKLCLRIHCWSVDNIGCIFGSASDSDVCLLLRPVWGNNVNAVWHIGHSIMQRRLSSCADSRGHLATQNFDFCCYIA